MSHDENTTINNPWVAIRRKGCHVIGRGAMWVEVRKQLETFFSIMTAFVTVLAYNKVGGRSIWFGLFANKNRIMEYTRGKKREHQV